MTTSHEDPQVSPVTGVPTAPSPSLRRAERELSAAQTRVHELERELDNAVRQLTEWSRSLTAATERIANLEYSLTAATNGEWQPDPQARLDESIAIRHCAICGSVLDINERECPRCEADAARDERTWFVGVQGSL